MDVPEHGQRTDGHQRQLTVMMTRRGSMKNVQIKLKWEWKMEGTWGAVIVMAVLQQLLSLPL